ncbi:MAG: hypothetical protein D6689_07695, partial [Deltaproteobacteria bacterium]
MIRGYTVVHGAVLVRSRLLTAVDVLAAASQTCTTSLQRIRRYELRYEPDADTGQPRLASLWVRGVEGTAADENPRPLARYEYGAATTARPDGSRVLRYGDAQRVDWPAGAVGAIERTEQDGDVRVVRQTLRDFTGDGLPDLVVHKQGESAILHRNLGGQRFDPAGARLFEQSPDPDLPIFLSAGPGHRHVVQRDPDQPWSATEVWVDALDFNGDGRLDILDARYDDQWRVYLNTPSDGAPGIRWRLVVLDIRGLRDALADTIPGESEYQIPQRRLPLSVSVTAVPFERVKCYAVRGGELRDLGSPSWQPLQPPPPLECQTAPPGAFAPYRMSATTAVLWKLADVNGDGYPDVVGNSAPVGVFTYDSCELARRAIAERPGVYEGLGWWCGPETQAGVQRVDPDDHTSALRENDPLVFYNQQGVRLGNGSPFASGTVLPGAPARCALEEISVEFEPSEQPVSPMRAHQSCGLRDLTGDGLPERVVGASAYLGTGVGFGPRLPGNASVWTSLDSRYECSDAFQSATFLTTARALAADLTGDGIADYAHIDGPLACYVGDPQCPRPTVVDIGTGVAAAPDGVVEPAGASVQLTVGAGDKPVPIQRTSEECVHPRSSVQSRLLDFDGDGILDWLTVTDGGIRVRRLVGDDENGGALSAHRLVRIGNGYGAVFHIAYASAKGKTALPHDVPYPEIVVSKTWVTGDGQRFAPTYRAYGGAHMAYDSVKDRWRMSGYRRVVSLRGIEEEMHGETTLRGAAVIRESIDGDRLTDEYARLALAGLPVSTHVLAGRFRTDAWSLVDLDLATHPNDSRYRAASTVDHVATWTGPPADALPSDLKTFDCIAPSDPYDFSGGWGKPLCVASGFVYTRETRQWRGDAAPSVRPGAQVATATRVEHVDAHGRPVAILRMGDTAFPGDDVCEYIRYAKPAGDAATAVHDLVYIRRLASPRPGDRHEPTCPARELDREPRDGFLSGVRYEYDGLPPGLARRGRVTQVVTERYATDTGALIDSYTSAQARYDAVGHVVEHTTYGGTEPGGRELRRTTTWMFDADGYGLVPREIRVSGADVAAQPKTRLFYDEATLAVVASEDADGVTRATRYDGFGRPVLTTIRLPGESERALTAIYYVEGEAATAIDEVVDRSVVTFSFPDGADVAAIPAEPVSPPVPHRFSETVIDAFGRALYTDSALGDDYGGDFIRSGERVFDSLGRVVFAADPYPLSDTSEVRYGSTFMYRDDGTLRCRVRGRGPQVDARESSADDARFPTCFETTYVSGLVVQRVRGPSELDPASPQAGAYDETVSTALGWVLEHRRVSGDSVLERSRRTYDRLGNRTRLTRYGDPDSLADPVVWASAYDSLGRVLRLDEPGVATRTNEYNQWGQLVRSRLDAWGGNGVEVAHDSFGRVVTQTSGRWYGAYFRADGDARVQHVYDRPAADPQHRGARHLAGRLSYSLAGPDGAPHTRVYYSYDALGRPEWTTRVGAEGQPYVERRSYRLDGRLDRLTFSLPDADYADEIVSYSYDTAGRMSRVTWSDGAGMFDLWRAVDVDAFGRVREAVLGNGVAERFQYADGDRRELRSYEVVTADGAISRQYVRYDAELRPLVQLDKRANESGYFTVYSYDALDRLERAARSLVFWGEAEAFRYDPLGNVVQVDDAMAGERLRVQRQQTDRDRICRVTRSSMAVSPPTDASIDPRAPVVLEPAAPSGNAGTCHYYYDAAGSVVRIAEPGREVRQFGYDGLERIRWARSGSASARVSYDPEGGVASLRVTGVDVEHEREEYRYGALVQSAQFVEGGVSVRRVERRIPGPGGVIAVRRGAGDRAVTLYVHGDARGVTAVTDEDGRVAQRVVMSAYGKLRRDSGELGAITSVRAGFDGGDPLTPFGVVLMGARIYDSEVGRFLQRDPLLIDRSAGRSHPYAFGWNDPIDYADPLGLDPSPMGPIDELCTTCLTMSKLAGVVGQIPEWLGFGGSEGQARPRVARVTPPTWDVGAVETFGMGGLFNAAVGGDMGYLADAGQSYSDAVGSLWSTV